MKQEATGLVKKVFGNLLHVEYQGNIQQGEVVMIQLDKRHPLKAEVIEIIGNLCPQKRKCFFVGVSFKIEFLFLK